MRPLALGYVRFHPLDPPEIRTALTAELHAYAEKEGLTLGEVYTDPLDPSAGVPDRAGFCALMDALRHADVHMVIIPTAAHLSRRPGGYTARRAIIESEGGARLLAIHSTDHVP